MANFNTAGLTSATTPLAGTEVVPVYQSGTTKQVSVANLTAGRSISAASLSLTTTALTAANGGTGLSSYTIGDLLYASSSTALSALADVATGNALISGGVGAAPSWGKIGLTTHVSGTLATGNGGTGLTSFTANGIVYASSTSTLTTSSAVVYNGTAFSVVGKYITVTGGGQGYRIDGVTELDRDQDFGWLKIGTTDVQIRFYTNSGLRQTIDTNGNIYVPAGSTSMTNGFFYIPAADGAPSGTPTSVSGCVPMYYDTTNNKFYIYNGAWKSVSLT